MSEPKRIQRKRSKGWRMPDGAVYVGRPTRWGNPFTVRKSGNEWEVSGGFGVLMISTSRGHCIESAVDKFRPWLLRDAALTEAVRSELRGRDLACWCPPDQPCHADVLLEVANGPGAR